MFESIVKLNLDDKDQYIQKITSNDFVSNFFEKAVNDIPYDF